MCNVLCMHVLMHPLYVCVFCHLILLYYAYRVISTVDGCISIKSYFILSILFYAAQPNKPNITNTHRTDVG